MKTKSYKFDSVLVTEEFRDYFVAKYPKVMNDHFCAKFLEYLLFSKNFVINTEQLLLSKQVIAGFLGYDEYVDRNFNAEERIKFFQSKFPKFKYQDSHFDVLNNVQVHHARKVISTGLDQDDLDLIIDSSFDDKIKNVDFITGKGNSTKKGLTEKKMSHYNEDQRKVCSYLNNLSKKLFTTIFKNKSSKIEKAMRQEKDKNKLHRLAVSYHFIKLCPKIEYANSEDSKSKRIYSFNPNGNGSVLQLPRKFRKIYFEDHWTADLRSSQFAILASKLDCKKCKDFLETGKSIWNEFGQFIFGREFESEEKDIVKEALYSIIFGANKNNLKLPGDFAKLLDHEMIIEIFENRKKFFAQIKKDKGMNDAYGDWIELTPENNALSISAAVMQSYEFKLMAACFDYVMHNSYVKITSFLHDGFTFHGTSFYCQQASKEFQSVVIKEAKEMGINVVLDITPPTLGIDL